MATYLFVHGAFQGGWIWHEVARHLAAQGHWAHTPTLTGCGHHFHARPSGTDLNTYIRDLEEYIRLEDLTDCILVGHSFSGLICGPLLARHPEVFSKAVFVDCLLPEKGGSFLSIAGEGFKGMLQSHRIGEDMVKPWPRPAFGVQEDKDEWFFSRLTEFPHAAFTTPCPDALNVSCPALFIHCKKTPSPFIQRMRDTARELGWEIKDMETGHFPMVNDPATLAGLLHATGETK